MLVWHYAPWTYLPLILESGELRPSNAGAPKEVPLLWFSKNQRWEPTAGKARKNGNKIISMTFAEQAQSVGCIRFGLGADDVRLLKWPDACTAGGISREDRRAMERVGRSRAADPSHWVATIDAVQLSELRYQVWGGVEWEDAAYPIVPT